jgi:predicted transposase/invertase (TIGR01784 family)
MTLTDVLFKDRINDISFVIDGKAVVLIEHQSTINKNIPLRMLSYITRTYEKICDPRSNYRSKMFRIPTPEFIVLYNGKEKLDDKTELKLSDMFERHGVDNPINLELIVRVYNINKGHNPEFAKRSATLNEYETFVSEVRENEKAMKSKEAIIKAIKDCENKGVLKEFLRKHSTEVINMLLKQWKREEAQKVWLEEGREEGRDEGRQNMQQILKILQQQGYDINTIKSKLPPDINY